MSEAAQFPCWRYHATAPAGQVFNTQDELDAAGKGWVDSPAKLGEPEVAAKKAKK